MPSMDCYPKAAIEREGVFCALYSDCGRHFWLTPKVGGKVDLHRLTQGGRALHDLEVQRIPRLLATSARTQRAQLLDLAGALAARTKTAQDHEPGSHQWISAGALHCRV